MKFLWQHNFCLFARRLLIVFLEEISIQLLGFGTQTLAKFKWLSHSIGILEPVDVGLNEQILSLEGILPTGFNHNLQLFQPFEIPLEELHYLIHCGLGKLLASLGYLLHHNGSVHLCFVVEKRHR